MVSWSGGAGGEAATGRRDISGRHERRGEHPGRTGTRVGGEQSAQGESPGHAERVRAWSRGWRALCGSGLTTDGAASGAAAWGARCAWGARGARRHRASSWPCAAEQEEEGRKEEEGEKEKRKKKKKKGKEEEKKKKRRRKRKGGAGGIRGDGRGVGGKRRARETRRTGKFRR